MPNRIVAANRDEFLRRPAATATWHSFELDAQAASSPRVLSGVDLTGGGAWLGISLPPRADGEAEQHEQQGDDDVVLRFATLTNITESVDKTIARPSRGALVRDFLVGSAASDGAPAPRTWARSTVDSYAARVHAMAPQYAGFNLLLAEVPRKGEARLRYVTNRGKHSAVDGGAATAPEQSGESQEDAYEKTSLGARKGCPTAMSNATLDAAYEGDERDDDAWTKVFDGTRDFTRALESDARSSASTAAERREGDLIAKLFDVLSQTAPFKVAHRMHLRHTTLVEPLLVDPYALLPTRTPPVPSAGAEPASDEPSEHAALYGTKSQAVLLVRSGSEEGVHATFIEREGFVLDEHGQATWSGKEHRFDI